MTQAPETNAEEPDLAAASAELWPLEGTTYGPALRRDLDRLVRLFDLKVSPRAGALDDDRPALLLVAGGTNVGKTSIANAVTGCVLGRPSPLARATKAAVACAHESWETLVSTEARFLSGYGRKPLSDPDDAIADAAAESLTLLYVTHEHEALRPLLVLDTPDMDSVLTGNREHSVDLLLGADAVLFVASEEKYNDEACLRYLREAIALRKQVIVCLNKHQSEEVLTDLIERVVPEAVAAAGIDLEADEQAPVILAVPVAIADGALARAAKLDKSVAPVRGAVLDLAADTVGLRRRAHRGARRALARLAKPVLSQLREEQAVLARYESDVERVADRVARAYRTGLEDLPLPEFERVFRLLADTLKIPVLDDVYARVRQATEPVARGVRRLFNLKDPHEAARQRMDERDARDLQQARAHLGQGLSEVRALAEGYPEAIRPALLAGLRATEDAQALFELDDEYAATLRAQADTWADEVLRELHEKLRQRPGAVALGKALKAALRVGGAAGAIALTGHIGAEDLVIAPAMDLLIRFTGQKLVDKQYFHRKRRVFCDRRAERLRELVLGRAHELALDDLEAGPDEAALLALEQAVERAAAGTSAQGEEKA